MEKDTNASWKKFHVFKTPNNPIEVDLRMKYIIDRIGRHQNSFPTSIIDVIRQQGEVTQVKMHNYIHINEEFKTSREEFAAIRKGRRAKKHKSHMKKDFL